MKTSGFAALVFSTLLFTSCVSTKHFNEITGKLGLCEEENKALNAANVGLSTKNNELNAEIGRVKQKNETLLKENTGLLYRFETNSRLLEIAENEKKELQGQIEKLSSGSTAEIQKLLTELQTARGDLNNREDLLKSAQKELEARNARLVELEEILKQKDLAVKELKNKVSNALVGFNNNGLTVFEKNGKVYVSLEEQLLFKTGKWDVDPKGQTALKQLSEVLAQNPDINVMVEGHTDDVAMHGSGEVKDNWDLSVVRATAVTKILTQNKQVDPKRIIAAGRSEFLPVDAGKSNEARQKNRRTEIILTPKLDELLKLIETN